jgi:hypothetical protein
MIHQTRTLSTLIELGEDDLLTHYTPYCTTRLGLGKGVVKPLLLSIAH